MAAKSNDRNDKDVAEEEPGPYLAGQFLIAMPGMDDPNFARTVIYMCAHNSAGAMGLVINRSLPSMDFDGLLKQLGIEREEASAAHGTRVQYGGPVEGSRGFVLHSADYRADKTIVVEDRVGITSTLDVLHDIANGRGPRRHLLVLGYASWAAGQLDAEIQANGWLNAPADDAILFDGNLSTKWERAIVKLGILPTRLSSEAGHA
jgi:putative transcriptional regulator